MAILPTLRGGVTLRIAADGRPFVDRLEGQAPDCYKPPMPVRIRKLIGAVALLALVVVWALLAMAIAQPALASANGLVAGLYYVLVGLGWVLPAMPLIKWMSRPDH